MSKRICICSHSEEEHTEGNCNKMLHQYSLDTSVPKDVECKCTKFIALDEFKNKSTELNKGN